MENADNEAHGSVQIVKLLMVREKSVRYERTMSCAETVINAVRHMFEGIFREQVVVVGLDSRNYPTILHINGVGSPNQSAVFIANIFRPLLLSNAVSCILVHNHPAGTMHPSSADTALTDKVIEIGKLLEIPLLDHLIINSDATEYFSFKKMGLIRDLTLYPGGHDNAKFESFGTAQPFFFRCIEKNKTCSEKRKGKASNQTSKLHRGLER